MKRRTFITLSAGLVGVLGEYEGLAQRSTAKQRLIRYCLSFWGSSAPKQIGHVPPYGEDRLAKDVLAAIGKPAVPVLCETILHDTSAWRRGLSGEALEDIRDPGSLPTLVKVLHSDSSFIVRGRSALALGALRSSSAVAPLLSALNLRSGADDHDIASMRMCAAQALGRIGDTRALPTLIGLLGNREAALFGIPGGSFSLGSQVAEALVPFGKKATPFLLKALSTKDEEIRNNVLEALGEIRDPSSAPALWAAIQASKSEEEQIRFAVALGRCGDSRARPYLTRILELPRGESLWTWDTEALRSLKYVASPEILPLLLSRAEKYGETFPPYLLEAIAATGAPEAMTFLMDALEKGTADYRARAARLLGERKERRALKALEKALFVQMKDDYVLRESAAIAVGRIAPETFWKHLKSVPKGDLSLWIRAVGTLKISSATPLIYGYTKHADKWIRHYALDTLGEIAPASYIARLEPLLYQKAISEAGQAAQAIVAIRNRQQTQNRFGRTIFTYA